MVKKIFFIVAYVYIIFMQNLHAEDTKFKNIIINNTKYSLNDIIKLDKQYSIKLLSFGITNIKESQEKKIKQELDLLYQDLDLLNNEYKSKRKRIDDEINKELIKLNYNELFIEVELNDGIISNPRNICSDKNEDNQRIFLFANRKKIFPEDPCLWTNTCDANLSFCFKNWRTNNNQIIIDLKITTENISE